MQRIWSVAGVVRGNAATRAGRPALTTGERTCDWRELDIRSNRVAHALAAAGVGSGDRVAFLDKNGPEYFEVLFGVGKLGAVMVAVNWRLAPAEMRYIVDDSGATVFFAGEEFAAAVKDMRSEGLKAVTTVVGLGAGVGEVAYGEWLAGREEGDTGREPSPEEVAVQLYTSGTTGVPKGAMLTNANLAGALTAMIPQWRLDSSSVSGVVMPLFHIGGSGWALAGMTAGAESVIIREAVPTAILDAFEARRVTNAFIVPALLQGLCAVPGASERDHRALRAVMYGASPITDQALVTAMETFRCDFIQLYGLTETTGAITQLDAADHDPGGPRAGLLRSAGRPYPWVELRVVDPDSGTDRAPGEVGELWTRSAQNMKGYWNKPDATSAVFTPDGWFKTGDAGYVDADGYVFLTDRIKDMIVSGGENIYPAEVENVLAGHPSVADVAVIGVPDPKWGETPKAVVVLRDGAEPDAAGIIAWARDRLAHYKCPTSVDFIDLLPRNPSGKVLKRELREPYWAGRDRRVN